jgi:hypothetical protein
MAREREVACTRRLLFAQARPAVVGMAALLAGMGGAVPVQAQEDGVAPAPPAEAAVGGEAAASQPAAPPAAGWLPTGLTGPVYRLFTPWSGAFLAAAEGRLLHSDDAGATWRQIVLPAGTNLAFKAGETYQPRPRGQGPIAVDPSNHDVLYAGAGAGGLHKSVDGGATWRPLPVDGSAAVGGTGSVDLVAVSPADPAFVHAVVRSRTAEGFEWRRLRSRDGGATWERIASFVERIVRGQPPLDYTIYLLQPHPTDPRRIFVAAGGTTGRNTRVVLSDASDRPGPRLGRELKFDPGVFIDAEHLVGGGGAAPERFYAAFSSRITPYSQGTRTRLFRADEGGAQTTLLDIQGSGSPNGRADGDVLEPAVFVDALAYDPSAPDRVYAGVNEYEVVVANNDGRWRTRLTRARSRVIASADGGVTWADLGGEDLGGEIHHLALGIDAANLYAATGAGVLRLPLVTAVTVPQPQ